MIKLEPFTGEFLSKIVEWHSQPEYFLQISNIYKPQTSAQILRQINLWQEDPQTVLFGVRKTDPLGYVLLRNVDLLNRSAELHTSIFVEQDKGLGYTAAKEMLRYGFNSLGLNSISTFAFEERVVALLDKTAFVREGVRRQALYKDGRFIDIVLYSILKTEWDKLGV